MRHPTNGHVPNWGVSPARSVVVAIALNVAINNLRVPTHGRPEVKHHFVPAAATLESNRAPAMIVGHHIDPTLLRASLVATIAAFVKGPETRVIVEASRDGAMPMHRAADPSIATGQTRVPRNPAR